MMNFKFYEFAIIILPNSLIKAGGIADTQIPKIFIIITCPKTLKYFLPVENPKTAQVIISNQNWETLNKNDEYNKKR